jgi:hypothetical protein
MIKARRPPPMYMSVLLSLFAQPVARRRGMYPDSTPATRLMRARGLEPLRAFRLNGT